MDRVFDEDQTAFLESGCAVILATAGPDGAPHASRGWGITVLPEEGHVRLLLDAEDATAISDAAAGGTVAMTGANVRTLRSMQCKGPSLGVDVASPADLERAERYCEAFYTDLEETDQVERALFDRLVPLGYVACTVAVDQIFDQTPGPGAGARLDGANR
jgi:hypothetical protein